MLKYILLGFIQGVSEFLPVSSSGHLVLAQKLLGLSGNEVALSAVLHLGTLFSLLIFFFKDILKIFRELKLLILIIIVTVITGIIGISGKDFFESLFSSARSVAIALICTGIILLFTRKFVNTKRENLDFRDAILLGFTQGLAIIPGLSRSGITISSLLFARIKRETAFRFSMIASIPAILGANLLKIKDINIIANENIGYLLTGFIASLVTGILSIWLLKLMIYKAKLYYFGYYCIFMAIVILYFL